MRTVEEDALLGIGPRDARFLPPGEVFEQGVAARPGFDARLASYKVNNAARQDVELEKDDALFQWILLQDNQERSAHAAQDDHDDGQEAQNQPVLEFLH